MSDVNRRIGISTFAEISKRKESNMKYTLRNMLIPVIGFFALILMGGSTTVFSASSVTKENASFLGAEVSPYKKYTMYLGTKDKNTGRQEISTEKMKSRMHEICMKYVDGYTVSVMDGYYRDEKGNPVHEVSLVYFFLDTPIDALEHIMEEAILEFNQSSILLEESEARSILYKGAHNAK